MLCGLCRPPLRRSKYSLSEMHKRFLLISNNIRAIYPLSIRPAMCCTGVQFMKNLKIKTIFVLLLVCTSIFKRGVFKAGLTLKLNMSKLYDCL